MGLSAAPSAGLQNGTEEEGAYVHWVLLNMGLLQHKRVGWRFKKITYNQSQIKAIRVLGSELEERLVG